MPFSPGSRATSQNLRQWAPRLNLVADHRVESLLERHVLDSLAAVPAIRRRIGDPTSLVDLGSGAGFPGIPLALATQPQRAILVEARQRRSHFLRSVVRRLGTSFLSVENHRATELSVLDPVDAVVTRATFSAPADFLSAAAPLLRPQGLAIAWRAGDPTNEPTERSPGFSELAHHHYEISGRQLHLSIWTRSSKRR